MSQMNCSLKMVRAVLFAGALMMVPTSPVIAAPATQPTAADVSPEARRELDAVRDAYGKLHSLQLHGVTTSDVEMGGKTQTQRTEFESDFLPPGKFKYATVAAPGDPRTLCYGSTGDLIYWADLGASGSNYTTEAAPPTRQEMETTDAELCSRVMQLRDPGLKMAMAPDAGALLTSDAVRVVKGDDVSLDGKTYTALALTLTFGTETALFDSQSHMLRQIKMSGKQPGPTGMMTAVVTYDYTAISADAPGLTDAAFAWTAPAGAREKLTAQEMSAMFTGHAAPEVTLAGLDGAAVKLSSLKGSVVVLDFWATWCGPCKLSLPHLNELDQKYRAKGVKVFAVDEREPKETVNQFIAANHYTFGVLLDTDGAAGEAYKADSIPVTAIIGKDGAVKKLLVGFGPETAQAVQTAVEAALAEHE